MAAAKRICLNMIVKNEIRSLDRSLRAVAPFISCWVIGDTGSTDGTQDFIRSFFAARGIPGELHCFPFVDFEQARNQALDHAYASPLEFDYLLFDDADMEVVVEDMDFRAKLDSPGYMLQTRGGVSYWVTRLARRDSGARYHGVTHEYLDVPGGTGRLDGVWMLDHATGSNRVEKFERDIRLLRKGLEAEPDNARYQFYLAESFLNSDRPAEAAETYAKRIAMGGWAEEVWYSRLQRARCFWRMGEEAGFLREAVAAFDQRPRRAEPLYDLARFYRQRGMNEASMLFAEAGLRVKRPAQDVLFIEDFVYRFGLAEEYSIAANYAQDPQRKERGFSACDWLALNRQAPESSRSLARRNLQFYAEPAVASMPSFSWRRLQAPPRQQERGARVCVARHGEKVVGLWTDGESDFLLEFDEALEVIGCKEIRGALDPAMNKQSVREAHLAFFAWGGALWRVAFSPAATLARIVEGETCGFADLRGLSNSGRDARQCEWAPVAQGELLRFVVSYDPIIVADSTGREIASIGAPLASDGFRAASQFTPLNGGWLGLVCEAIEAGPNEESTHYHRFVWLNAMFVLQGVSRPFYLESRGRERVTGLCAHPDGKRLVLSFVANDGELRLATVLAQEAASQLLPAATYAAESFRHEDRRSALADR
ncbi:hypothetical protein [Methylocystis bryophila]|uniref:Glycosyltransferase 2-like domain-containing protein n=1 Tax=Methylocystis bryophila TaxID=655015 RepID=A0A1W6MQP0_9HYPH|nr:hypothetical protein [Methylocystis bryophila]ARN79911.1 hypothetical protein B1812_01170 [Methylocystis bryophila]BDV39807.1 hypothetical protein DSM21852_30600 [Methylocystis bryophila]